MEIGAEEKSINRLLKGVEDLADFEFEDLCTSLLEKSKIKIKTSEISPGRLRMSGEFQSPEGPISCIIEAKKGGVEPEDMQELASQTAEAKGIYISTADFSKDARTYGEEFSISMIDGRDLALLLKQYNLAAEIEGKKHKEFLEREGARFLPSIETLENLMKGAKEAYAQGDLKRALESFSKVIDLKPNYDLAWSMKGKILSDMGEEDKALQCFAKAVEYNLENEIAWFNLATSLCKVGRHQEEMEAYDKAIKLKKDYLDAWLNKGVALHELKRYEEAIQCYDHVLNFNPKDAKALSNKGAALKKLRKFEEALNCYDEAIDADEEHLDAWLNKSILLEKMGRNYEALKCLDFLLSKKEDSKIWYLKGLAHLNLMENAHARESFEKALELEPTLKEAKIALRKVKRRKERPGVSRSEYECWGEYEEDDEGCKECDVKDDCRKVVKC